MLSIRTYSRVRGLAQDAVGVSAKAGDPIVYGEGRPFPDSLEARLPEGGIPASGTEVCGALLKALQGGMGAYVGGIAG